jgi:hypothetical protein
MDYPTHILEPIRREVAESFLQKEMRRLLPSLSEESWPKVDQDIAAWFEGSKSGLAGIHDFWNGFDGIASGFRLKALLVRLTASNMRWSRQNTPLDTLILPWADNILPRSAFPEKQITGKLVRDRLAHDTALHQEVIDNSDYQASFPVSNRDKYPIIILKEHDEFRVLDGNRRSIRGIVYGQTEIDSYIGEYTEGNWPRDYWVTTGELRLLCAQAQHALEANNTPLYDALRTVLKNYLANSPARVNFENRVKGKFPACDDL